MSFEAPLSKETFENINKFVDKYLKWEWISLIQISPQWPRNPEATIILGRAVTSEEASEHIRQITKDYVLTPRDHKACQNCYKNAECSLNWKVEEFNTKFNVSLYRAGVFTREEIDKHKEK